MHARFAFIALVLQARAIEKQIQAAKARDEMRGQDSLVAGAATTPAGPTELRREDGQSALRIGLNARASTFVPGGGSGSGLTTAAGSLLASASNGLKRPRLSGAFGEGGGAGGGGGGTGGSNAGGSSGASKAKGKRSVIEAIMEQERAKKAAKEKQEEEEAAAEAEAKAGVSRASAGDGGDGRRKDYWLRPGIVVKVMNKKVGGGKYYKKKARLRKVVERYVGEVKMLESGDRLRVDQEDLETVRKVIELNHYGTPRQYFVVCRQAPRPAYILGKGGSQMNNQTHR